MNKKFPEADPNFYKKFRAHATTDFQRGIVFILQATGMHLACLLSLKPNQMNTNGYISWARTKTGRPMRAKVPKADRMTVRAWIDRYGSNKKSASGVQKALRQVGARAGFPDASPMTFRAQRAVRLLDEGEHYHDVAHLMGCSPGVLMANYAQLKDDRRVDQGDIKQEPWEDYINRWGSEFDGSPCGSCGHNTNGDIMDSDVCFDAGCDGAYGAWKPPEEEVE